MSLPSSVWAPPEVNLEPVTEVSNWVIMKVKSKSHGDQETYHVVGYCGEGRVSSRIVSFDLASRTAKTRSGRNYVLKGRSGLNLDATYVWGIWGRINGVTENTILTEDNLSELSSALLV